MFSKRRYHTTIIHQVDGEEVKGSEGVYMYNIKSYFSGQAPAPDVITLTFEKEGPKITIQIVQTSDRFRYSCAVDGNPTKEIVRQMQKNDSNMNDFIITIPEIDITRSADEDSKGVVWYTVYVVFESSLSLTSTRTHSQYNHLSSNRACLSLQHVLTLNTIT